MNYNFDEIITRRGSNCIKWDEAEDPDIIPLWVADMVGHDAACARVLNFCDRTYDGGADIRILKDAVRVGTEGAVFKHQLLGIAQRLLACDVTSHESHIL